jgi:hypothetical protein
MAVLSILDNVLMIAVIAFALFAFIIGDSVVVLVLHQKM